MPDVYATIAQADLDLQERLADVIELRAADPRYQVMVRSYLSELAFIPGTRALEIGCGTGSITRILAQWTNVDHAHGIDPSPVFMGKQAGSLDSECFVRVGRWPFPASRGGIL